ncbi:hypothetical protein CEXT_464811 [Caerostris extrusa]|uniref:Uncharacterized protein n=1 Tax=Caerostris extrusa TaxID=172846 RepID=A0AAV4ULK4_CAEEX|nr:hypothetical protein CEXT_464811 [Caerostris extrusa]
MSAAAGVPHHDAQAPVHRPAAQRPHVHHLQELHHPGAARPALGQIQHGPRGEWVLTYSGKMLGDILVCCGMCTQVLPNSPMRESLQLMVHTGR